MNLLSPSLYILLFPFLPQKAEISVTTTAVLAATEQQWQQQLQNQQQVRAYFILCAVEYSVIKLNLTAERKRPVRVNRNEHDDCLLRDFICLTLFLFLFIVNSQFSCENSVCVCN